MIDFPPTVPTSSEAAATGHDMPTIRRTAAPPARRAYRIRSGPARKSHDLSQQASFLPGEPAIDASPVRVLIALGSESLSDRLAAYLERGGEFAVVVPRNGRPTEPDVAIVDYRPATGIPALHGAGSPRSIALARVCDDDAFLGALRGGAWALLTDRPSPFEVTAAVRQVAAGECPILGQIGRRPGLAVTALGRLQAAAFHPNPLSAREAAILTEVARGAKNGVIGAILGLREQTVKNYLSEILRKTGAGNRAEAAALAVRRGWVVAD